MYNRVLIPLDGSEAAEAAIEEALRMAPDIQEAELVVVDESLRGAKRLTGYVMYLDQWIRVRREMAMDYLRSFSEQLKQLTAAGVRVETSFQMGDVFEVVRRMTTQKKFDLVLLGGQEGCWFRRNMGMAGIAKRLARSVNVPVFLVTKTAHRHESVRV